MKETTVKEIKESLSDAGNLAECASKLSSANEAFRLMCSAVANAEDAAKRLRMELERLRGLKD